MCKKGWSPVGTFTWEFSCLDMKKILCSLAICHLALASCVNGQMKSNAPVNDTCHVERYFHSFMSRFPDGLDNDIKKKRMNEQFVLEITDSLKSSSWLLEDFPLRFEGLQEAKDGKCKVHFQSWIKPSDFKFKDFDFREFAFDLVGEIPEEDAINLVDDNFYIVHGHLNRFLSHEEFKTYASGMAYTPNIGIEEEIGLKGAVNWHLGEMLFDIDSISSYK